ncbi:MAG: helix-turn-helix domain-containing protein [Terriglobales bacterium]
MGRAMDYKQLIAEVPPKVIRTEAENEAYLEKLTELTGRWNTLSAAEKDLYDTLKLLIEDFENRAYRIPKAKPIEIIEALMQANGLKQKDLVGVFSIESVVSEVLNGSRNLTVEHIQRLSERFNLSPAVFFPRRRKATVR